jgi:thiamine-monophosphate kinase
VPPRADRTGDRLPPGARVADLGELALLDRIARRVGPPPSHIVLGIGDDAAALRSTAGALTLITTDALVEDVHFRRATSSAADVGWKALAINVSDIASMGGAATAAVISLMLPPALDARWVDDLYDGLAEAARAFDLAIVGGNLTQAPAIVVDVTVLGEAAPADLVSRRGAQVGDLIAVTGTLGRAAAGLAALETGVPATAAPAAAPEVAVAIGAQRRPRPRLSEGRCLAGTHAIHAMIDLSDGLALDLSRVCAASGVGARIDAARLPIDPAVATVARHAGRDPLDLSLSGGEDYELLFTFPPAASDRVLGALAAAGATQATIIGTIVAPEQGRTIAVIDEVRPLDARGWTHFRRAQTPAGGLEGP